MSAVRAVSLKERLGTADLFRLLSLVSASAHLPAKPPNLWEAYAERAIELGPELDPQALTKLLSSFARADFRHRPFLQCMSERILRDLDSFSLFCLTTNLHSFASLSYRDPEFLSAATDQIATVLRDREKQRQRRGVRERRKVEDREGGGVDARMLATISNSLARLDFESRALMNAVGECLADMLDECNGQDISTVANAFARQGIRHEFLFEQLGLAVRKNAEKLTAMEIATISNAWAKLRINDPPTVFLLSSVAKRHMTAFTPQGLGMLCSAMARMNSSEVSLFDAMAQDTGRRLDQMKRKVEREGDGDGVEGFSSASASSLLMILNGLSSQKGEGGGCRYLFLFEKFSDLLVESGPGRGEGDWRQGEEMGRRDFGFKFPEGDVAAVCQILRCMSRAGVKRRDVFLFLDGELERMLGGGFHAGAGEAKEKEELEKGGDREVRGAKLNGRDFIDIVVAHQRSGVPVSENLGFILEDRISDWVDLDMTENESRVFGGALKGGKGGVSLGQFVGQGVSGISALSLGGAELWVGVGRSLERLCSFPSDEFSLSRGSSRIKEREGSIQDRKWKRAEEREGGGVEESGRGGRESTGRKKILSSEERKKRNFSEPRGFQNEAQPTSLVPWVDLMKALGGFRRAVERIARERKKVRQLKLQTGAEKEREGLSEEEETSLLQSLGRTHDSLQVVCASLGGDQLAAQNKMILSPEDTISLLDALTRPSLAPSSSGSCAGRVYAPKSNVGEGDEEDEDGEDASGPVTLTASGREENDGCHLAVPEQLFLPIVRRAVSFLRAGRLGGPDCASLCQSLGILCIRSLSLPASLEEPDEMGGWMGGDGDTDPAATEVSLVGSGWVYTSLVREAVRAFSWLDPLSLDSSHLLMQAEAGGGARGAVNRGPLGLLRLNFSQCASILKGLKAVAFSLVDGDAVRRIAAAACERALEEHEGRGPGECARLADALAGLEWADPVLLPEVLKRASELCEEEEDRFPPAKLATLLGAVARLQWREGLQGLALVESLCKYMEAHNREAEAEEDGEVTHNNDGWVLRAVAALARLGLVSSYSSSISSSSSSTPGATPAVCMGAFGDAVSSSSRRRDGDGGDPRESCSVTVRVRFPHSARAVSTLCEALPYMDASGAPAGICQGNDKSCNGSKRLRSVTVEVCKGNEKEAAALRDASGLSAVSIGIRLMRCAGRLALSDETVHADGALRYGGSELNGRLVLTAARFFHLCGNCGPSSSTEQPERDGCLNDGFEEEGKSYSPFLKGLDTGALRLLEKLTSSASEANGFVLREGEEDGLVQTGKEGEREARQKGRVASGELRAKSILRNDVFSTLHSLGVFQRRTKKALERDSGNTTEMGKSFDGEGFGGIQQSTAGTGMRSRLGLGVQAVSSLLAPFAEVSLSSLRPDAVLSPASVQNLEETSFSSCSHPLQEQKKISVCGDGSPGGLFTIPTDDFSVCSEGLGKGGEDGSDGQEGILGGHKPSFASLPESVPASQADQCTETPLPKPVPPGFSSRVELSFHFLDRPSSPSQS
uniref:RNA-editing substrate-binding complex 6 protein domain-containing protein n=1 Tax=Chromera velia CCMP2878 TaxID=1169474 RepID=A0A0G4FQ43_9ALVE|eukprot:Cvel_18203.t1-p1 / transcript=Cvel_18203.t1 / gene=Cvel_18203 / organism=Chromera_velia_CCMP2878 / gene_product=hypothetical protein / transcript_product=hypothetical protein / location=Cvel_scaffold1494:19290-26160(+) / protein_length=1526 / sequence_SO=supercontig / SO=protein_coding / is_pseudo=false